MTFSNQFVFSLLSPEVQDGAAALILEAVTLLVDFGSGVGRVTLHYGVEILQPLELVVTHLLPVTSERTHTHQHTHHQQIQRKTTLNSRSIVEIAGTTSRRRGKTTLVVKTFNCQTNTFQLVTFILKHI